jgi:uncharacterized protein YfaS (alpha-2-macroglobulin family)/tetratricopeptide (TPR) repeat protein
MAMCLWAIGEESKPPSSNEATKKMQAGNFKEAFEVFHKLGLDPKSPAREMPATLNQAIQCLQQLGRVNEIDEFREKLIEVHKDNWRLLQAAAQSYLSIEHNGVIIAGKFQRGPHRGGDGRHVHASERDRVRALQLLTQAMPLALKDDNKADAAQFHFTFAQVLMNGMGHSEPWKLQVLTDLTTLPDYEDGYWQWGWRRGWGGQQSAHGAPVDADGNPIFYSTPKSYAEAKSDGERWRWMLAQTIELNAARKSEVLLTHAAFLQSQFGVETMAHFGWWSRFADDSAKGDSKSGTFAIHTLGEDETIANLATGVKRFKLPDEFNPFRLWQTIIASGKSNEGQQARELIAHFYENRRQYPKAVEAWKAAIAEYGPGNPTAFGPHRQVELDQIVKNWGRFEPSPTQPSGKGATVDFRFRNGNSVTFTAHELNVAKLLDDVKKYLKSSPAQLNWQEMNLQDIGHRIVVENQQQYVGAKAAEWTLKLTPRASHVDDRVTVTTPLQKPGAYLVESKMGDGNSSRVILWVADTVIVRKNLEGQSFYFVADAVSGQPIAKANVEMFGWKQEQVAPNKPQWKILTKNFSEFSNADGQLLLNANQQPQEFQWVAIARTDSGRLAFHGFTHVWFQQRHDPEYNQIKTFTITDRPVYRPGQKVQFKHWIGAAKYDQPDSTLYPKGSDIRVDILNPKGEKVFDKQLFSDEFGGVSGEFELPKDAQLGVWQARVHSRPDGIHGGGGSFRVEEYKKPEFEVKIDSPKEPVALGDQITATIKANYYFGGAVTKAKVKYKVLRTSHSSTWYPAANWDWFYGRGYWWFCGDYDWYPGWRRWGCAKPYPIWWARGAEQPEVVVERETEIGEDGTVAVEIDTSLAKAVHGDTDHSYSITAEVVDQSRRTIVGTGNVLVAREPFRVFAWVNRGHYRAGDDILAEFRAQTVDQKPVQGTGELTLFSITYNEKNEPVEKAVQTWKLDTNEEGYARQQMKAAKAGQYRLSYKVTGNRPAAPGEAEDRRDRIIEGGYLFVVRGDAFDGKEFRFNDLELVTEKREYAAGEKVRLMVNTNKAGGAVLLFLRPTNGVYLPPKLIRLDGKSHVEEIAVVQRDMPNFFVEAVTVADARVHQEVREVVVPPEKRVLNVTVQPSQDEYKPGSPAKVQVKLTDSNGKPFVGSTVLSIYDKSVEYISGGSNVPEIKEFFWKWRRHHHPQTESSLDRYTYQLLKANEQGMSDLGVFGGAVVEEMLQASQPNRGFNMLGRSSMTATRAGGFGGGAPMAPMAAVPEGALAKRMALGDAAADKADAAGKPDSGPLPNAVQPTVRSNFADTAFWAASVTTNKEGLAEVALTMPEQLTGWKVKCWAMGLGTKVGQGEAEITTKKNLLVRLQAPRFFVQKDEVVLSANVHNYLKIDKEVEAVLEIDGRLMRAIEMPRRTGGVSPLVNEGESTRNATSGLTPTVRLSKRVRVKAGGEQRVDWRVNVIDEGEAVVRMSALTDEESDAMEMKFPVFVHGMLKTESWSGVIRPDKTSGKLTINVPKERRANQSRLEVRYSPTLAGAMVDALPYLVDYPYGCTEQTLNRFLPTVVTQRILRNMGLDLKAIQQKRTNLNAQEIGDDVERAKGWKRFDRNPVFDEAEVATMVKSGLERLTEMQCSDGGWGWFSGWGEHSYPHTTAVVVHGLQIARENDVAIVPGVTERGIEWLKRYQAGEVQRLKNSGKDFITGEKKSDPVNPWKDHADALDAFVYMVLIDADHANADMLNFLYRDRTRLPVYAKALFGLALHKQKQADKLAMILQNIEQFLVQDDENQTAYLKLPENNSWWYWYGSDIEANAYYLKLLSRVDAKDERASGLVKYLLNNRKHATYWNSTRDSATCIEAMADYLKASGEDKPNLLVEVLIDGELKQTVEITPDTLFGFNNKFVIEGEALTTGAHVIELRKKPLLKSEISNLKSQISNPLYFNAYLTNFTLEEFITKAGLEVKVNRKYYKLTPVEKKVNVAGSRGQVVRQKVEKYERSELANLDTLKSGDLVEVELEIDSKNDYEYLLFEDPKASGFEPVEVRSGYNGNEMHAYVEFRDERVAFFVRALARGQHSLSYRLRAEIPGMFSALPTKASAMYAPELKANSDEIKLAIED